MSCARWTLFPEEEDLHRRVLNEQADKFWASFNKALRHVSDSNRN